MKKNAILMIDFALETERQKGVSSRDAIYEACLLRFRPILMTTMAALLGGLPLALGTGTGSELRRPLGITIVGGLIVSQLLTLYTTPVVYLYLDRLSLWFERVRGRRRATATGARGSCPRAAGRLNLTMDARWKCYAISSEHRRAKPLPVRVVARTRRAPPELPPGYDPLRPSA